MNWKPVVGCLVIVLLGLRLPYLVSDLSFTSYGLGQLVGVILVALVGVWLIRSGRKRVRR